MLHSRKGFTMLELLIVLAVLGLLLTLAGLSLSSARARVRDAQRLSDVSLLTTALSRYWLDRASYPRHEAVNLGAPGSNTEVLSAGGFEKREQAQAPIYLDRLPRGPKTNEFYNYHGSSQGFSLRFRMEGESHLGKPNIYFAHANGIINMEDLEQ